MPDAIDLAGAKAAGASAWISWVTNLTGTTPGSVVKQALSEGDRAENDAIVRGLFAGRSGEFYQDEGIELETSHVCPVCDRELFIKNNAWLICPCGFLPTGVVPNLLEDE